jgi:hypothetical protein
MDSQCPAQSLQSFPVQLQNFTPTSQIYEALVDPISLSFTWGDSTIIPSFSAGSSSSGELYHPSFVNTFVSYQNTNYSLTSVEIVAPTHTKWLVLKSPDAVATNNIEDVILTFTCEAITGSSISKNPQYIILVNPVIRTSKPITSSSFLTAFANQTSVKTGPDSLFPNDQANQYARYTTCARGITPTSDFQNIMVIINTQGLLVYESIMQKIEQAYVKQKSSAYPPQYVPVYYNLLSSTPSILNANTINTAVTVSYGYGISPKLVASAPIALDLTTDAYKCVPLDPEKQVNGVGLQVNSSTGEVLTTELAARQEQINKYNSTEMTKLPYTILEKYSRIFLIISISIAGVFIIAYTILSFAIGPEAVGTEGHGMLHKVFNKILDVPVYVIIAFFCTFVGLMVGAFISPNSGNTVATPPTAV